MPGAAPALTPRRLLLLALAFLIARALLVACAADRISEPDLAEVKLMAIGDAWIASGEAPSADELLATARTGANAPHGGFLPLSLAYAALARPGGRPGRYGLLKLLVLLLLTVSFVSWVAVADRLGGPWAATTMALLLALPPPSMLGAQLVAWGSHPEAAALLGPTAWLLFAGRDRGGWVLLGAALGCVAGFSTLLLPLCAVWAIGGAWDAWWQAPPKPWLRPMAAAGLAGLLVLGLLGWVSGSPDATVTEDSGSAPLELLHAARADVDPTVRETAANLLPPRVVSTRWWGQEQGPAGRRAWDRAFGGALLVALLLVLPGVLRDRPRRGRTLAVLVLGPLALGLVLACLGPRRPWVPPRYLLALWPAALLALSLAVGRSAPRWRWLAAAPAVFWLLPGAATQADLLRLDRAPGFSAYAPAAWVAAGIGHAGYAEAEAVNAFLARRAQEGRDTVGFGLAAGEGGGEALLLDGKPPHLVDPADLLVRRAGLLTPGLDRRLLHENLGWGLAAFAPGRKGTWLSVLERLGPDREATAFGLGQALRTTREGCRSLRALLGPDRDAVRAGARALTGPELPRCAGL